MLISRNLLERHAKSFQVKKLLKIQIFGGILTVFSKQMKKVT